MPVFPFRCFFVKGFFVFVLVELFFGFLLKDIFFGFLLKSAFFVAPEGFLLNDLFFAIGFEWGIVYKRV